MEKYKYKLCGTFHFSNYPTCRLSMFHKSGRSNYKLILHIPDEDFIVIKDFIYRKFGKNLKFLMKIEAVFYITTDIEITESVECLHIKHNLYSIKGIDVINVLTET